MRRVVIIGSGRTGRGMFGEMFYLEGGFDLVFADIDSELIGALREQGYYTVEKKKGKWLKREWINSTPSM